MHSLSIVHTDGSPRLILYGTQLRGHIMLKCRGCNNELKPTYSINEKGFRRMVYKCGCGIAEPMTEYEVQYNKLKSLNESISKPIIIAVPGDATVTLPKATSVRPGVNLIVNTNKGIIIT